MIAMLEQDLKHILAIKRRMPNPYRGHPRFFFGMTRHPKKTYYYWSGVDRKPSPWHPQVVFQYTLSGWGIYSRNQQEWKIDRHKAFITIVPSNHLYQLPPNSPGWSFFFLTFQHPYIAERITDALKKHSGVISLNEDSPLIIKSVDLIRLTQKGLFADEHEEEAHLLDWMCCAERALEKQNIQQLEKNIWQTRIRNLLEQNLASPLAVEELARHFDLSRSHFTRLFTQKTEISPAAFITALRLYHVEEALRLSTKNLTEIALDCGYADANHLCKAFKREYGITPGGFRKQLRNQ
jgi:AraC-like DNA-binding protein